MLVRGRAYLANDIGNPEGCPVEEQQRCTRVIFRKCMSLSSIGPEQAIQPVKVVQVARLNAEELQLEPSSLDHDADEAEGKNYAGGQAVDIVMAERDRGVSKQEGE